jgi:hypothetical protein
MQYVCKECNIEFKSLWGLSSHSVQKHKLKPEDLYVEYELKGQKPTCACGCGETPNFLGIKKGFVKYILGHASRINNNWGHNVKANERSHQTQKKLYESGKLKIWNKGLTKEQDERLNYGEKISSNKERSQKISKTLKGRKRPKEVLEKLNKGMLTYWSNDENREKKSHERMLWMLENDFTVKSKLEEKFLCLIPPNVEYIRQHYVREIKAYYDFYIPKNNLLIEIDGDFWHCNPNGKYPKPIYESQFKNLEKDKIKTDWCVRNNIPLLRFWEKDINDSIDLVKSKLSEYL